MRADLRRIDKCKACGSPIIWTQTSTGKAMPVDASPVPTGNVLLFPTIDRKWLAMVVSADEAKATPHERYVSHFATCPAAARFRRPAKSKGGP